MSRKSRRQRKKTQAAFSIMKDESADTIHFIKPEQRPVYFLKGCPPPEPRSSENNSSSQELYMKRIRRFSRLANVFNHLALWIFIIGFVGIPVAYYVNRDLFPEGDSIFHIWGLVGFIIPGLLAIANRLTADFVMVNIRNYCFTIYPYEHQKGQRIEEIQQLTLEYIGLLSSQFLSSLFNRR